MSKNITDSGIIYIIAGVAAALGLLAMIKKPASVYRDKPEEQNPMEGRRVRFVEDPSEPVNADGMRGRLEVIGATEYHAGFYEAVVKRGLDILLSFCGLLVLSPVLLALSVWIIIDDPGPVLFTQKRIGRDKRYFKLHNVSMKTAHRFSRRAA